MNKKIVFYLCICIIVFIGNIIYYDNKTEKVFISGKVFGFKIQTLDEEIEKYKDREDIIPTSLKKIGTMTFIKPSNKKFAALGHSIKEMENINNIDGKCYNIVLDEIEKGSINKSGKIIGQLDENKMIGEILETNNYGIFGIIDETEKNKLEEVETASRYEIKRGEAEIAIDIDDKGIEKYKIEIKEIDYLHKNQNMKIKITSKELIGKTGGIVQGMSGTPIMQNGKLIGAINYVDSKDPTSAYAIFIDKLL